MANRLEAKPGALAKDVYHYYISVWGEPNQFISFYGDETSIPGHFDRMDVAVWSANAECEVTTFVTIGASADLQPNGCESRFTEYHWAIRAHLDDQQVNECAKFLANVTEYPFSNKTSVDWWHRLKSPGDIPLFPNAVALLFRPPFSEDADGELDLKHGKVRVLYLVPLQTEADQVISDHGIDGYLDYLERNEEDPLGTSGLRI